MKIVKNASEKQRATEIAGRFIRLLESIPGSLKNHSTKLGYASPSTIYAVKKGDILPDLIKLNRLAERRTNTGRPNIDWVVTGEGDMMILNANESPLEKEVREKIMGQPRDKLEAILILLDSNSEVS